MSSLLAAPCATFSPLGALTSIPKDVLEAAEVDGATRWQRFRLVTLPLLGPVSMFVLIVVALRAFEVFDTVRILKDIESSVRDRDIQTNAERYANLTGSMVAQLSAGRPWRTRMMRAPLAIEWGAIGWEVFCSGIGFR